MTRDEIVFRFQKFLMPLTAEQMIQAEAAALIVREMGECIDEYRDFLTEQLLDKAISWEVNMEDSSLYSLGLRHAVDLITEFNPTLTPLTLPKEQEDEQERKPSESDG